MVYNMLVAFRFYVSFISFLGFVHAKIRIILYKKELLYRKIGISDFCTEVVSKMEITTLMGFASCRGILGNYR